MLKVYMDLKTSEAGIVGGWTILLNGMVTPSILTAPIPGASWPFCCQAAVQDTMHIPTLAGSDEYDDLRWFAILQRDNILTMTHYIQSGQQIRRVASVAVTVQEN